MPPFFVSRLFRHSAGVAVGIAALLLARSAPGTAPRDPSEGVFLDDAGEVRAFRPVAQAWFGETERRPHYVRALAEMGALLTLGTIHYWVRPSANAYDWDLPSISERLNFEAVRFDTNLFFTNFFLHPAAGGAYYGFARLNDLSVAESGLYTMFTSTFWEYALEFREKVSINDLIFTPAGGVPIGAFFSRLADYTASAPGDGAWGNRTASWTLGLPRWLHRRDVDPNSGAGRLPADALGFSSAYSHDFRLGYQASLVEIERRTEPLHVIAAAAGLVAMPGYQRPGRFAVTFAADNFTEAHVRAGFSRRGLGEIDMRFRGTLVGYYAQDLRRSGAGGLDGHADMLGLDTGLRYVDREYLRTRDMYASTHLVGATGAHWLAAGAFRAKLAADVHYDFAAVRSLAFPEYRERSGARGVKGVLAVQGYQFGVGPTVGTSGEARISALALGAFATYSAYGIIGGLDRMQEEVTRDLEAHETILESGVWVGHEPPRFPAYVKVGAEWIVRTSELAETSATRTDTRLGAGAGLRF